METLHTQVTIPDFEDVQKGLQVSATSLAHLKSYDDAALRQAGLKPEACHKFTRQASDVLSILQCLEPIEDRKRIAHMAIYRSRLDNAFDDLPMVRDQPATPIAREFEHLKRDLDREFVRLAVIHDFGVNALTDQRFDSPSVIQR